EVAVTWIPAVAAADAACLAKTRRPAHLGSSPWQRRSSGCAGDAAGDDGERWRRSWITLGVMRFPRRFTRSVSTVALVCSSAGLTSCGGATPPAASAPAAPSSTTTPTESSATDHLDEDGFELRIRAAEVRVGSDSSAEIELLSKQPFKCNDKYPYKFTTTASE